jgi:DNA-binding SARP family transcriptional activator
MAQFMVLGSLEFRAHGRSCRLSAPKVRQVLAVLLSQANRLVSTDALYTELWGDRLPPSAATTLQTYVYQLRKLFDRERVGADLLVTRAPGYLLQIEPTRLDAFVFEQLGGEGRDLLDRGQIEQAGQVLRTALDLWRGEALADVAIGPVLEGYVAHLLELRTRALELRIEADLRLGRHRELVPELRALVSAAPLNEWLHARLIEALDGSGRRAEALHAYQTLRTILSTELGLDPAPELQLLQHKVLNGTHTRIGMVA